MNGSIAWFFNEITTDHLHQWFWPVLAAAAILAIGRLIAKVVSRGVGGLLHRSRMEPSVRHFLTIFCYYSFMALVVIAALAELGVDTTSLAAMVGAAGLAIGFALRNTLANVAAGLMLITLRPFRIGEFVELAGTKGTVKEISVFHTVLTRPDNCVITIPNGSIVDSIIVNFTRNPTRRCDLTLRIPHRVSLDEAKAAILEVLQRSDQVLVDPAPFVAISDLDDSAVQMTVRAWVATSGYVATRSALLEALKASLEKRGISTPAQQREVHLVQQ